MLAFGIKLSQKTIYSEKIDYYLICMSMFSTSKVMYPHVQHKGSKILVIITVKECIFKLI